MNNDKKKELILRALKIREKTVDIIMNGKGGHLGGDLSEVDLLVGIFDIMNHNPLNSKDENRDYFLLSKGHSAEAYYAILNYYGYLSDEELGTFGKYGSKLGGHPTKKINGVEANTGSLGHGLGLATGIALGLKMKKQNNRVFVLTGDGELAEGSNWEAALSAAAFNLTNLTWIIDRNHLQISGNTEAVMPLENLSEKIKAFGFHVMEIDGHDYEQIFKSLQTISVEQPLCIIANTIKGKGLLCAENNAEWHHKTPTMEQFMDMKNSIETIREALSHE